MKIRLRLLLCLLWLGSTGYAVHAKDIFVNNQLGDDHNDGGREHPVGAGNGPTRTINRALRAADRSDRIIIANTGEPYRECISLQGKHHSGTSLTPFLILGGGAVLDGSVAVNDRDWLPYKNDVVRFRPPRVAFQTFFLGEEPAERVKLEASTLSMLQPKQWSLVDGMIYFRVEPDHLLASYNPHYGGHPVGITMYDVHDIQIFDLQIRGYQLDGLNAHDNVRHANLVNIDSSYNGRSGISIGGSCRVNVIDCSGTGNGAATLHTEGYCKVNIEGKKIADVLEE